MKVKWENMEIVTMQAGGLLLTRRRQSQRRAVGDVMEFKKTYTGSEADYVYANGALMSDYNKNICMFRYNYLQLPQSVQFRRGDRIEYVYDAAGVKRQVTRKVSKLDLNYLNWSPNEPKASDFDANKTVTTDYIGNKIYVNNQLKYILTEEGYVEKSGTTYNAYYYLNDHLGSHRIVMDASGTVKQVNNFYPSGTSMAERRDDQGIQPYKFIGKELDRTNNLDFYDFENRAFDPVLMRFNRTDPMAEKYGWMSSLAYALNNPIRYIDLHGDSISVAEEYREQFNNSLNAVFGNNSQNFGYTSTGMLTYNGSTKGMTKDQKAILNGMTKVMNESTTTNIVYGKSTQITDDNGNTITMNASTGGGASTALASENSNLSQNTILIDPAISQFTVNKVTSVYYITPIDPANGDRFIPTPIQSNVSDATFHEIGHVVYQGQTQDKVIDFNNKVRNTLGLPKRPYDETHNRTILKQTW